MAIFGQGNQNISAQQIQQFLANPNLSSEQILAQAQQSGVSLDQIRAAAPNDQRFAQSNQNLLPFLASQGITPGTPLPQENIAPTTLNPGSIPTGLRGAELAFEGGLTGAQTALDQGLSTGRADLADTRAQILSRVNQGVSRLTPFSQAGTSAINQQAGLSGALGNAQQAQSFSNFNSSPGQQFLREKAERSLLRNSSALGGIGGGRVRAELQRQAIGEARQDFGDSFDRIGQVSGAGLNAFGQQNALISQGINADAALGGQLSNQQFIGGQIGSSLAFNTGQNLASGRTRAGEQVAANISNSASALASLVNQQGTGLSNTIASSGGNLASILAGSGQAQELTQQQLATLLSNISVGEGTTLASVRPLQGIAAPLIGATGSILSGLGAAFPRGPSPSAPASASV